MAHATTLGFGGWPRFLMMSAAFIRVIIRVARSNSLGVGRVGLKQTASESASVAEVDVQLLALLVVSAETAGGWGLGRARLDRLIPTASLAIQLKSCADGPRPVRGCEPLPWVVFPLCARRTQRMCLCCMRGCRERPCAFFYSVCLGAYVTPESPHQVSPLRAAPAGAERA